MRNKIQQGWRNPGILNYLLLPVSWLYSLLIDIRRWAYQIKLLPSNSVSVPVIVVGGITAGGAGKTPVVIALVEYLNKHGYKPGVISRGYGGNSSTWPRQVDSQTTAEMVGDEPQLIFERCDIPVVVGPNRVDVANWIIDKCGCDIIISDDGFQHFALNRDIDIVVVDGQSGMGNGWCLPSGPLRETNGLSRANWILINGSGSIAKQLCEQYPEKTVIGEMALSNVVALHGDQRKTLEQFVGQTIIAMAGVGNPDRFFSQLETKGLTIQPHPFEDHHLFQEQDLHLFENQTILMTEKDAIKCRRLKGISNAWYAPGNLEIDSSFFKQIDLALNQRKSK